MLDIILSSIGLVVLSPVFLGIIIAIKIDDPGPVVFKQKRVGIHKKYFELYKFRSMKVNTPELPTHMLENPEQYISRVGRFLRKSSLDELPQLINIIKGDMSIIGPRPALWSQEDLLAEREKYGANDVRPGLSGWAQIHGRDELPIPQKAALDGVYVERMGFFFDVRCFLGTIFAVLRASGVVEGKADQKKKLLVITNHSFMLWRFRKDLLLKLQEEYEIVINTPFTGHEEDFEGLGFRMIESGLERRSINLLKEIRLLREYGKLIKKEKPDLVLTYSIKPNIYAGLLCRSRKIPYVVNVQGLGTTFHRKICVRFVEILYRMALKDAKVVFFENAENAEYFCRRYLISEKQKRILPGAGIDVDDYTLQPYEAHDKVHFLYMGRIMREKGVEELLAAIRMLQKEYGGRFVLDMVGFYEDAYKEQVDELTEQGVIAFHGFQKEPRPYYVKADCVVQPSHHEGLSNVLLEAAAMGRAVITTDIPGCREAACKNNGLLCPAKDAEGLYEQMKHFMELPVQEWENMGRRGRKLAEEEFEKKMVVEMTISEIRRCMGA